MSKTLKRLKAGRSVFKNLKNPRNQNGEFFLSSFYFGNLNSHKSFEVGKKYISWGSRTSALFSQDVFFNDVSFGIKRSNFLDSVEKGCDYCFWMIHYRRPFFSWC